MTGLDINRVLRRLKPEKHGPSLQRRSDAELLFVESEAVAGAPLLLDSCVYIHVLRGKTPQHVDELLRARTIYHSAVAISELTNRLGSHVPQNERESDAQNELRETIADIPQHRMIIPSVATWAEAGVLAGMRARLGGYNKGQEQDGLNDAILLLQARSTGVVLLTANVLDFDLLQQLVPDARVLFYRAT
ncbi:MAG: PIN domain-containing protein [Hyphomicrobiales bacterium]|nr:PIN domain-containing protein [Hyphomicrobiales bacterium]MBV9429665.1 PIN domain-containing protein [Bradyrhizobiaceae bacterium]